MKAVNLIPPRERRGVTAVSRSGGGAYLVLGTLAALVLMMAVYALEGGKIDTKQAEAAQSTQEAAALEAKASSLSQYSAFAALKDKRIQTVSDIAKSRFDWSNTLHDLARVIPPNTWLTSLTGTVSPSVTVSTGGGGGGGGASVRSAIEAPAIEISGCTTSQPAVARMMAKMRNLDDVDRVTLTSSEKTAAASGSAGGSSDSSSASQGCDAAAAEYPHFQMVVFFKPLEGQTTSQTAPAAAAPTTGASQ